MRPPCRAARARTIRRWRRTAARPSAAAPARRCAAPRGGAAMSWQPSTPCTWPSTAECGRQPSHRNSITAATIASTMPWIAPSSSTPAVQPMDSQNSQAWMRWMRCRSRHSIRPMHRGDDHRRQRAAGQPLQQIWAPAAAAPPRSNAPTTPVICDFEPAASATGVRDELLLIGKALEQARRQVGRAQRHHLLVRVDRAGAGAAHRCATARWCRQRPPAPRPARRPAPAAGRPRPIHGSDGAGSPCGSVPSTPTPCAPVQVEERRPRPWQRRWR